MSLFSSFQIYSTSFIDNKYLFFFFLSLPPFSRGSTIQPTNHRQHHHHHPVLRHATCSSTEFLFNIQQAANKLPVDATEHYSLTSLDLKANDRHVLCFPAQSTSGHKHSRRPVSRRSCCFLVLFVFFTTVCPAPNEGDARQSQS